MKPALTVELLCMEAKTFARQESNHAEPNLYGVTDGKAVGTYLEHKFQEYLRDRYDYRPGSSAKGIDFPEINVDVKVTRITQPQSSCPFKSARQKVYGLGYNLLVFVYDKIDEAEQQTGRLNILHTAFVAEHRTADYQTTSGLQQILENNGNVDDVMAFLLERYLPLDDIQAGQLAEEIMLNPPRIGYLTISNALQWRLQYRRVIELAGHVEGIQRVL
jgi:hypothetical protein